jgi:pimeloyl-ACP methyl ester carboxylesterase
VLVSGAGLPADLAFAPLLAELGDQTQPVLHALELFSQEQAPTGYTLETEIAGITAAADAARLDQFHLVGYSGGGGASLAFAAEWPQRLLSLALIEPAWAGNDLPPGEQAVWEEFERIGGLAPSEVMTAFVAAHLAPGVPPPPPPPPASGSAPPWMARVPARLPLLIQAFGRHRLDMDALSRLQAPVYYAFGGLSNPDYFAAQGRRLAGVLPDFTSEEFNGLHHFDPPHRAEPSRVAASLQSLWTRAEGAR